MVGQGLRGVPFVDTSFAAALEGADRRLPVRVIGILLWVGVGRSRACARTWVERKVGQEMPAGRFSAAMYVGWESAWAARLDRRTAPGVDVLRAQDGVDQQWAVFGGGMLQPACKCEHGRLEVIGLADELRGMGNAAAGPGKDQFVCVMLVVEEHRVVRDVAERPAAKGDDAQVR